MTDQNINTKFCSFCGSKIGINAQFCFACGERFDERTISEKPNIESSQPSPTPAPTPYMSRSEEIKLILAEKRERIAKKIAQRKKEIAAKRAQKKETIKAKKETVKAKKNRKKSYKRGVIVGVIFTVLAFSVIGFFVVGFMTYGDYQQSYIYYYEPTSPEAIEKCIINAETAGIQISYNSTPVDYYVKVEVNIHVAGLFVSGKRFDNFYEPILWDNSSSANLSFTSNFWLWIDPTNWFKVETNMINVMLRTDVVYDITAETITGGVLLDVPENTTLNDIALETTTGGLEIYGTNANFSQGITVGTITGGLIYNFTNCYMGNDITGTVITGGITYNSYNMEYEQATSLTLSTTTGGIDMNIQQYNNMSADVTSSVETTTGGITIDYTDTSADFGAKITGSSTTGSVSYTTTTGFNAGTGTTKDYDTATNTYTITATTTTGGIIISGTSIGA